MSEVIKKIGLAGIIPVIKFEKAEDAVPLANTLARAGLDVIEVTFRTPCAADAIAEIIKSCPDVTVGAGTILTEEQAQRAIDAGAEFAVSPALDEKIVKFCQNHNVDIIPGVQTCTEINKASQLGLNTVKFFPAEVCGGTAFLKSVAAVFPNMKFMPTGGITEDNANDYLRLKNVVACGGSFMAKDVKNLDKVYNDACRAVSRMLGFEIKHVGINCDDAASASHTATGLCGVFGEAYNDLPGAVFVGDIFEVLKSPLRGRNGHIAIATFCPDRARHLLEKKGYVFDESSALCTDDGKLKVMYMKDDVGGFALHLLLK